MASSATLAADRYSEVQKVTRGTVRAVQGLWGDIPSGQILAALQGEHGRLILNAVIAGQLSAASGAEAFVSSAMLAQAAGAAPLAKVVPGALANIAADGRPLASLLFVPAVSTMQALAQGLPVDVAMTRGLTQMAMIVATTIADTARTATSVAMTAHPRCVSYVRVVKLPACSRCVVLASRQYSYSTGFQRHPKCDCGMEPMSDAEWKGSNSPEDLFKRMTPDQRQKTFGAAGADAIEKGADIGQVVNARRGMATTVTGKKVSTEGTTKRGIGGASLNAGFAKVKGQRYERSREARLMPEQILKNARGNRELQIAVLRKHGYIS